MARYALRHGFHVIIDGILNAGHYASMLLDARQRGYPMDYTAQRIRQDRAEAAELQRLAGRSSAERQRRRQ